MASGDRELHARWCDGDEAAGRELFRKYAPNLLRFFRSKLRSSAEDLTQEVFARFLARARHTGEVRVSLFSVARRVLHSDLERRQSGFDEDITSVVDVTQHASTRLVQRRRLLTALQSLPVGDQIAIELHYWEGLSSAEIGAVFGTSASAARSRLHLARQRLRSSLAKTFHPQPAAEFDDLEQWALKLRLLVEEE